MLEFPLRRAARQPLACVTLLAAALFAGSAAAADPAPTKPKAGTTSTTPAAPAKPAAKSAAPREGSFGKGTSTLPFLTRDQLRQCLAEQDRIKTESADLAQAQARLDKDRADIERLGTELAADKAKVDTSDEAAVNAYNERARQRAKRIEDFKAAAPLFNQRVDKLVADRQAFATACADRRYFEDDLDDIKAGR